jgi:uncharacterized protein with PIN domain
VVGLKVEMVYIRAESKRLRIRWTALPPDEERPMDISMCPGCFAAVEGSFTTRRCPNCGTVVVDTKVKVERAAESITMPVHVDPPAEEEPERDPGQR